MFLYFFLKITLGFIGFCSFVLMIICFFLIIRYLSLDFYNIGIYDLLNFSNLCDINFLEKKCEHLIAVYWLIVTALVFFGLSLVTLYPFFKMRKKEKVKTSV